ncbi:hypothetical protein WJX72_000061 [[Myrmecia] bisecta]|uniref:Uncharacterized protein n=1 Tax=[Myrmecia] bisecta TaxID=41462 RepID=A0AAW1PGR8_9CHLO
MRTQISFLDARKQEVSATGKHVVTHSKEEREEQLAQERYGKSFDELDASARRDIGSIVGGEATNAGGYTESPMTSEGLGTGWLSHPSTRSSDFLSSRCADEGAPDACRETLAGLYFVQS